MNEEKDEMQKDPMHECATELTSAAQALERVMGKLEAQYESLNQKIDHIVATVDKLSGGKSGEAELAASAQTGKMSLLERENRDLRQRTERKTLAPMVTTLLAKSGVGEGSAMEAGALDKALSVLTIEQRIAVKAELARAGMLG